MQMHSKDNIRKQALILDRTLGELPKIWGQDDTLLRLNVDAEKNSKNTKWLHANTSSAPFLSLPVMMQSECCHRVVSHFVVMRNSMQTVVSSSTLKSHHAKKQQSLDYLVLYWSPVAELWQMNGETNNPSDEINLIHVFFISLKHKKAPQEWYHMRYFLHYIPPRCLSSSFPRCQYNQL